MHKVSIITPAYNSAKFIKETIESVMEQTYHNWEMIIVDDCSTDSTIEVIKEFAFKDNRIKYFTNDVNQGAAICRNIGLENARGRFIAFIDSDDLWEKQKLEIQLNFMLENHFPITFTEYNLLYEGSETINKYIKIVKEIDYYGYLKNTIIGMSTSIIDKSIVGDFRFKNIRTRQDTYLWISLLKRGYKAFGLDKRLATYRVRRDSISADKIKAARRVWYIYYNLEKLGLLRAIYYFNCYTLNAIKKRFI